MDYRKIEKKKKVRSDTIERSNKSTQCQRNRVNPLRVGSSEEKFAPPSSSLRLRPRAAASDRSRSILISSLGPAYGAIAFVIAGLISSSFLSGRSTIPIRGAPEAKADELRLPALYYIFFWTTRGCI